ncbi:MAG: hypothetical protein MK105_17795 [Crocinitomicaceae bacterium]|nr:hypothetical protein [Crocinitomicaceae bacterium]
MIDTKGYDIWSWSFDKEVVSPILKMSITNKISTQKEIKNKLNDSYHNTGYRIESIIETSQGKAYVISMIKAISVRKRYGDYVQQYNTNWGGDIFLLLFDDQGKLISNKKYLRSTLSDGLLPAVVCH